MMMSFNGHSAMQWASFETFFYSERYSSLWKSKNVRREFTQFYFLSRWSMLLYLPFLTRRCPKVHSKNAFPAQASYFRRFYITPRPARLYNAVIAILAFVKDCRNLVVGKNKSPFAHIIKPGESPFPTKRLRCLPLSKWNPGNQNGRFGHKCWRREMGVMSFKSDVEISSIYARAHAWALFSLLVFFFFFFAFVSLHDIPHKSRVLISQRISSQCRRPMNNNLRILRDFKYPSWLNIELVITQSNFWPLS